MIAFEADVERMLRAMHKIRRPARSSVAAPHFGCGKAGHARLLLERRLDFHESVRVEPVEPCPQSQRVGSDMADLDPVARVHRLGQQEWTGEDVDAVAGCAVDPEGDDLVRGPVAAVPGRVGYEPRREEELARPGVGERCPYAVVDVDALALLQEHAYEYRQRA